jgi:hypothetical protein
MRERDTVYTFRDEVDQPPEYDHEEHDVVIVDGEAMTYRSYRR